MPLTDYRDVAAAARMLGVTMRRVRAMVQAGQFPDADMVAGSWIIPLADLRRARGRRVYEAGKAKPLSWFLPVDGADNGEMNVGPTCVGPEERE